MKTQGLVKIGSDLYQTVLPLVQAQVDSQIKVKDFSKATLKIYPSDHPSWSDARTELISEAKTALKAKLEADLAATSSEATVETLRASYNEKERAIEHDIDNQVYSFNATIDMDYNFL